MYVVTWREVDEDTGKFQDYRELFDDIQSAEAATVELQRVIPANRNIQMRLVDPAEVEAFFQKI